jgi:hypothetical protein
MSLVRYRQNPLVAFRGDLTRTLQFHAYNIYYWLRAVAPIIIKYQLIQIGRDGINNLPYLSWETKQEIKRWIADFYWETEQEIQGWLEGARKTQNVYEKAKQELRRWLSDFFD